MALYGALLLINDQPDRATFFVAFGIWLYITNTPPHTRQREG